jgi:hypothetical protein
MENPIKNIYDLKAIATNKIDKKNLDDSKGFAKQDFFRVNHYEPLINQIKATLSKLTVTRELIEELDSWIVEISLKSDKNKIINGYWSEFKADLTRLKNDISDSISKCKESNLVDDTSDKFIKIPISDIAERFKSELNQSEVSLLFLYLRDFKLIDSVSDDALSKCINILTGHSYKQILKKIAGKSKTDKINLSHVPLNYDKLAQYLQMIIEQISKDSPN